ncbi:hypothetical protein KC356_g24 [Hortaea werneckii]|nr:hypothetical protein KC356_g24 [Hortaea werneckii]
MTGNSEVVKPTEPALCGILVSLLISIAWLDRKTVKPAPRSGILMPRTSVLLVLSPGPSSDMSKWGWGVDAAFSCPLCLSTGVKSASRCGCEDEMESFQLLLIADGHAEDLAAHCFRGPFVKASVLYLARKCREVQLPAKMALSNSAMIAGWDILRLSGQSGQSKAEDYGLELYCF